MADTDYAITNIGDPWTAPAGTGSKGATGDPRRGQEQTVCPSITRALAQMYAAQNRHQAPPETPEKSGESARRVPRAIRRPVASTAGATDRTHHILIGGGDGQQGGQGGPGGAGSPGGNPGTAASGCANKAVQGTQGSGGQGGPGGPVGRAAKAALSPSILNGAVQAKVVNVTVQSVAGGDPGIGGVPGGCPTNAGDGVKGGRGTPGAIPLYALNNRNNVMRPPAGASATGTADRHPRIIAGAGAAIFNSDT